jgi:Na+/proline symporter
MNATAGEDQTLEKVVLTRLLRLNATIQGVVAGIIAGMVVFVATNWLVLKGGDVVGPHLALLGQYFIGYRVTFLGSLIGFVYAFVTGFVLAYCVARLYNIIVDLRERRQRPRG